MFTPPRSAWVSLALAGLSCGAHAQPARITLANAQLVPGATTIVDQPTGTPVPLATAQITVGAGRTLTVNGRHAFASLTIENAGVVLHDQNTVVDASGGAGTDVVFGMALQVSGDVTILAGGTINLDGRGYPANTGPGAGAWNGSGGCGASGGGYGGQGGFANCLPNISSPGGLSYGSAQEPQRFGSGGGRWGGWGNQFSAAGGGALRIDAHRIILHGSISARGTGNGGTSGAGAGGGVRLSASEISGSGLIDASGGNDNASNASGGAGGGGRVAVYTCSTSLPVVRVAGGIGLGAPGAPGTFYLAGFDRSTADFDSSGFVDSDDFVLYLDQFSRGCVGAGEDIFGANPACVRSADADGSGFIDADDFVAFIAAFQGGC